MLRMGFSQQWIDLVMACVTSVNFMVLINGQPGESFSPSRGLRQGDPLSPYLFILVCEVLSRNVKLAAAHNHLDKLYLSKSCPGISHLFFADDSLFFSTANTRNANRLHSIIHNYCLASGQSLNIDKSALCFSISTTDAMRTDIAGIFNVPIIDNPGTYLGIPSTWGKTRSQALSYIKDRVRGKIDGWKSNILSQAGREVLIKSIAPAVPRYPMHIFLIPKKLCNSINSDLANFLVGLQ